ncbi:MAG TPA: hypothetical protein VM328_11705, partial [Fimbriimonadaceae bacterium]|nr:hypothetical protein [Fimbriimonadaceae bacterium]
MARIVRAWPSVLSAALVLLAFPPFNLGLLVFVALAPWLATLRDADAKSALKSSYAFGLTLGLGQMFFLMPFVSRWTGSYGLGLAPWLLTAFAFGLYFLLAGWLMWRAWRAGRPWAIPLIWAGVEFFRSYVPVFAFPWGLLATPLWPLPQIVSSAYYGSIYLVSAWIMLPNLVLALFLLKERPGAYRGHLTVFALVLMLSALRYSTPIEGERKVIVSGQPGVDLAFGRREDNDIAIREAVAQLSSLAQAGGADLLVLPEGLVSAGASIPPATNFDVPEEVPVLFGGQRGRDPKYQSAFAYDGKWSYADKTRLVIFGEFVPGRDWIPFLSSFNLPSGDLAAADKIQTIEVAGIRVGAIICFEALFHNIAATHASNGARLLA